MLMLSKQAFKSTSSYFLVLETLILITSNNAFSVRSNSRAVFRVALGPEREYSILLKFLLETRLTGKRSRTSSRERGGCCGQKHPADTCCTL